MARLPVADMPPEWHDGLWQTCHDWLYRGAPDRGDRDDRLVFPAIPQLAEVTHSPTVRGALSSILGADFAQHPHRTMHNYGKANGHQDSIGGDQTWHKDGHHVPMRSHHPRWVIVFVRCQRRPSPPIRPALTHRVCCRRQYYPHAVTEDMGPTGILPGATYTTIDHADSAQDFLQDVLEAYLETDETNARKSEQQKSMTDELTKAGRDELETRDLIRGHAETAAVELLGASPPRTAEERAVFGDDFGPGQWKLLCPTGTAVVMDYNIFHVSAHIRDRHRRRPVPVRPRC